MVVERKFSVVQIHFSEALVCKIIADTVTLFIGSPIVTLEQYIEEQGVEKPKRKYTKRARSM